MHLVLLSEAFSSMPLGISVGDYNSGERDLAAKLFDKLKPKDILLLDRGLGGQYVYQNLNKRKIFFVHRSQVHGKASKYIKDFITSKSNSKNFKCVLDDKSVIKLRLVRGADLPSGEPLVYVTNLLNEKKYSHQEIHILYSSRWKIETNINHLKNTMSLEKIRSKTLNSVLQDTYAHFIVLALAAKVQAQATKEIVPKMPEKKSLSIKYILRTIADNMKSLCTKKLAGQTWQKICELAKKIIWHKQFDRHYPRYSRQPQERWTKERSRLRKLGGKNP